MNTYTNQNIVRNALFAYKAKRDSEESADLSMKALAAFDELTNTIAALTEDKRKLKEHIIKSDDFVEKYGEFPLSCVVQAMALLDERRALLAELEAK